MKTNNLKAYTLVEVILMIALITLGSMGVYTIYNKLSISKKVELETLFILNSTEKLDAVYNVSGTFSSLDSEENIKKIGIDFNKSGGLEFFEESKFSISSGGQQFNFNYHSPSSEICIKLGNKLGNSAFADRFAIFSSQSSNIQLLKSNSSISALTNECNNSQLFSIAYSVSGKFQNIFTNPSSINPSASVSNSINPLINGPSPSGIGAIIGNLFNIDNSLNYSFSSTIFDCITGLRCIGTNTYVEGSPTPPTNILLSDSTPPPSSDLCSNIAGIQSTVPSGMTRDASGNCVTTTNECVRIIHSWGHPQACYGAPVGPTSIGETVTINNINPALSSGSALFRCSSAGWEYVSSTCNGVSERPAERCKGEVLSWGPTCSSSLLESAVGTRTNVSATNGIAEYECTSTFSNSNEHDINGIRYGSWQLVTGLCCASNETFNTTTNSCRQNNVVTPTSPGQCEIINWGTNEIYGEGVTRDGRPAQGTYRDSLINFNASFDIGTVSTIPPAHWEANETYQFNASRTCSGGLSTVSSCINSLGPNEYIANINFDSSWAYDIKANLVDSNKSFVFAAGYGDGEPYSNYLMCTPGTNDSHIEISHPFTNKINGDVYGMLSHARGLYDSKLSNQRGGWFNGTTAYGMGGSHWFEQSYINSETYWLMGIQPDMNGFSLQPFPSICSYIGATYVPNTCNISNLFNQISAKSYIVDKVQLSNPICTNIFSSLSSNGVITARCRGQFNLVSSGCSSC